MLGLLSFMAIGLLSLYKILIEGMRWLQKRKQAQ